MTLCVQNEKGQLHRLDGPAYETTGVMLWFNCDKLHRLDGPAVERTSGNKEWWINGQRHRLDGPAVIHADGKEEYWINEIEYNYLEYLVAVEEYNIDILNIMHYEKN